MCVVEGLLTFRSVGNSSFFIRPVAAAMFPAPENIAPPRCDACSLVFSATRAGRGLGKGFGGQGEGDIGAPSPVVTRDLPFPWSTPSTLGVPFSTTHIPTLWDQAALRLGEGKGLCRAGLVPEVTPCTTPSLVLFPAGRQRGTFKGSELRVRDSGKHSGYTMGRGT